MPEIEIRQTEAADILSLIGLDHSSATDVVWQMEFHHDRELSQVDIKFREVKLPRPVRFDYPRPVSMLRDDWQRFSGLLVATIAMKPAGYASMVLGETTKATWITDLVVDRPLRRQGIGSALLLSCMEYAINNDSRALVLEMQPRNGPAIALAEKMGLEFCGYNDGYYSANETAVFFRRSL